MRARIPPSRPAAAPGPAPALEPAPAPGPAPAPFLRITHPDRAAFLDAIEARLAAGRGFSIATLNLDHAVKLGRDPAFAAAYAAHSHVVADGAPIVWLSRLAGRPVDLIPGSELVDPLCAAAARTGAGVALLGTTEAALAAAAARLAARHPGLRVVLRLAPPMGFDPDGAGAAAAGAALRDSGAGLCLLALGAPRQERLAARLQGALPGCGFASVGAGLDFAAGSQARAPAWMRRLALEWLWRLAREPRRLGGRYAACAAALPGLAAAALGARRRG